MRDHPHLHHFQCQQRQRDLSPSVKRLAKAGDARARALVYRNTQSTEAQAKLLERWGMLATLQFDSMGEPMFA